MAYIKDGYLTGTLKPARGRCPVCTETGRRVIDIALITMPIGFGIEATILWNRNVEPRVQHACVGLDCGCYARFHRQLAHIVDSRKAQGHAV